MRIAWNKAERELFAKINPPFDVDGDLDSEMIVFLCDNVPDYYSYYDDYEPTPQGIVVESIMDKLGET